MGIPRVMAAIKLLLSVANKPASPILFKNGVSCNAFSVLVHADELLKSLRKSVVCGGFDKRQGKCVIFLNVYPVKIGKTVKEIVLWVLIVLA